MSATMYFSGSTARTLLQGGRYIECAHTPSLSGIKTAFSRKAVVSSMLCNEIIGLSIIEN